jgi:hypothetical protein
MRNHRVMAQHHEHNHVHMNVDLQLVICRRLVPELERLQLEGSTPQGLADAEECMQDALRQHGAKWGVYNVLMSKLFRVMSDQMGEGTDDES